MIVTKIWQLTKDGDIAPHIIGEVWADEAGLYFDEEVESLLPQEYFARYAFDKRELITRDDHTKYVAFLWQPLSGSYVWATEAEWEEGDNEA